VIKGMNHIGFTVRNLDTAVAFLTECAGFTLLSREGRPAGMAQRLTGVEGAQVEIAFVQHGTLRVELLRFHAPDLADHPLPTPAHPAAAHLALDVEDIEAFMQRAAPYDLHLLGEILTIPALPNKGGKVAYACHPSGLCLELLHT